MKTLLPLLSRVSDRLASVLDRLFFIMVGFVAGATLVGVGLERHFADRAVDTPPVIASGQVPAQVATDVPAQPDRGPDTAPAPEPPPAEVTGTVLLQAFTANEVRATAQYGNGRVLHVVGVVSDIGISWSTPRVSIDGEINNVVLKFSTEHDQHNYLSNWLTGLNKGDRVEATCTFDNYILASVFLDCTDGDTVSHPSD